MDFLTNYLKWLGDGGSDRALQGFVSENLPSGIDPYVAATFGFIVVVSFGVWCCIAFSSEK